MTGDDAELLERSSDVIETLRERGDILVDSVSLQTLGGVGCCHICVDVRGTRRGRVSVNGRIECQVPNRPERLIVFDRESMTRPFLLSIRKFVREVAAMENYLGTVIMSLVGSGEVLRYSRAFVHFSSHIRMGFKAFNRTEEFLYGSRGCSQHSRVNGTAELDVEIAVLSTLEALDMMARDALGFLRQFCSEDIGVEDERGLCANPFVVTAAKCDTNENGGVYELEKLEAAKPTVLRCSSDDGLDEDEGIQL